MKRLWLLLLTLLMWPLSTLADDVWVIDVKGGIGPAISDYVSREIDLAHEEQAKLIVLRMDTPGGLDTSMRDIIHAITVSPVPIATWVGPAGSRAASAGTYILLASHLAVMAPGTNLGAATPVSMGGPPKDSDPADSNPFAPKKEPAQESQQDKPASNDDSATASKEQSEASQEGSDDASASQEDERIATKTAMEKKVMNDAAAYIQSLAKLHGRNEVWAERAVREAASLDAESALKENVIDYIAPTLDDLIEQANGRTVKINGVETTLDFADVAYVEREQDWRFKLLTVLTNPNVAYILMLIGIYGLLLEFYNPGVGVPGVLGGICLILAMYSLQLLPVSYAGLGLLMLGIALMVAEAFSPSFGIFGFGGIVAFVLGSIMLMDTEVPGYQIAMPLIIGLTAVSAVFCFVIVALLLRVRRRPVTTGVECMQGQVATVVSGFPGEGKVMVEGEIWQARSPTNLAQGDRVVITKVAGLWLDVDTGSKE
ncbi:serine protease [Photobacterium jeanii]|uniref:Serine protease n=1 Tax=Photobacterium jeanii TaxID=858640 RepID=A0A178K6Y2_9GAMM|nr:nodulation protein NfeD [Photobacterium jeanii]OAN13080.1 serine protease [Photobacterium jeanii]PST89229.1 nodulation protein NfeD [Photobacterium jeanii]